MASASLNRRRFLHGLGGAAVAAPFLSSVVERAAKAAGVAAPAAPKRLIVMYTHYGCLTDRWFPAKSHGRLTKDDYLAMQTLKPLAPHADKLLMVRGIRAMNEWSFDGSLGQKNEPHAQASISYFTCAPITPDLTSGMQYGGHNEPTSTARSLDYVCAEQVNPQGSNGNGGPPLRLDIGGPDAEPFSSISWSQPGIRFPGAASPLGLFNALTSLFGPGSPSPDTYKLTSGKSIIDLVREDLRALQRVVMSNADQKKLSDWADLLHQTTGSVVNLCTADNATKLGLTSDTVMMPVSGPQADLSVAAPLMLDLAALSAMCDLNRVIFIKFPPAYVYKFLGLIYDSNSISHRIGNAGMGGTCVAGALEMVATIDAWYAQQFAHLVGRLDGAMEGDRSLLDNSATVWFQEMSDGNSHNLNNLPILQAGNCGGYFKTGWAVNVEGGKADMTPGNSDSDCQDGQSPFNKLDALGTPPDVATMPINKYFCNLMNAIGVKAGADGFPATGGTQEVTRYGKYDDTKLFGTTEPAQISNPGEYKELRANS